MRFLPFPAPVSGIGNQHQIVAEINCLRIRPQQIFGQNAAYRGLYQFVKVDGAAYSVYADKLNLGFGMNVIEQLAVYDDFYGFSRERR